MHTDMGYLYNKELNALSLMDNDRQGRKFPTVAGYCEKWLVMQSTNVRTTTLTDYIFMFCPCDPELQRSFSLQENLWRATFGSALQESDATNMWPKRTPIISANPIRVRHQKARPSHVYSLGFRVTLHQFPYALLQVSFIWGGPQNRATPYRSQKQ